MHDNSRENGGNSRASRQNGSIGLINVGSGKGTTIAELARRVIDVTGSRSKIEIEPSREIEVSRFIADVSRARQVLGLTVPEDPLHHLPSMISTLNAGNPSQAELAEAASSVNQN